MKILIQFFPLSSCASNVWQCIGILKQRYFLIIADYGANEVLNPCGRLCERSCANKDPVASLLFFEYNLKNDILSFASNAVTPPPVLARTDLHVIMLVAVFLVNNAPNKNKSGSLNLPTNTFVKENRLNYPTTFRTVGNICTYDNVFLKKLSGLFCKHTKALVM